MSMLSMMEARLPPGFRFHPRDEELVCDYLANKLNNISSPQNTTHGATSSYNADLPMMIDVDLNKCEPWDLPEMSCVGGKEWYFFSLRDRKYATGQRTNRATQSGYWKATGKDRQIRREGVLVGMRKTLVFYQGRAPKGKKTDWVMHEFRMEGVNDQPKFPYKEDWVLCRVFYKSIGSSSRPNMETSYDDDTNLGSSSLPSLTEDTYNTIKQTPLEGYEQVPCFSNLSQNSAYFQPANAASSHAPLVERNSSVKSTSNVEISADINHCDNKVLMAVLNHFKLEGNAKNELFQSSTHGCLENYISENGFSYMWNSL